MSTPQSTAPDLNDIVFDDWVERWLPRAWRPYARLCRLDRPIGTWLTLLPCIAALVQASGGMPDLRRLIVFSLGALLMRGIGCTVNDMWDRDIDRHVERTRFRPLTSGQITMRQAVVFLIAQLLVCASLLFFINELSRWWALAVLPFVFIYPFCKRVTYWPQVVLGICFNWGMLMAWSDTHNAVPLAAIAMWFGAVLWQVGYDSIYAYIDVRDDRSLGLHSTAMRFGDRGKTWIGGFYVAAVALWAWAGYAMGLSWPYQVGMAAVALHLAWQLKEFDIRRPERGLALFRANLWTGVLLIVSAFAGTL
ncbi:4-hydroxybenzoate octaprenyltransferase [Bordetella genomosp. 5]|uniref:4-hydroxybenzoate octaprenyltransferase n=1 Tax=Bordetella genomosp. 5 TaxID=1395608 RepID=A0A261U209_9BORD|nr:4-hydroxybenzoate octaprenyltransferase [Bordetella genomosp. 5]OZI54893.1 4-hydroxybenzoate polyprenyltransferase [Bordetella genomosp. 5]